MIKYYDIRLIKCDINFSFWAVHLYILRKKLQLKSKKMPYTLTSKWPIFASGAIQASTSWSAVVLLASPIVMLFCTKVSVLSSQYNWPSPPLDCDVIYGRPQSNLSRWHKYNIGNTKFQFTVVNNSFFIFGVFNQHSIINSYVHLPLDYIESFLSATNRHRWFEIHRRLRIG